MAALPTAPPLPRGQSSPIRIDGAVAYVGLGRGLEAVVDFGDIDVVARGRWLPFATRTGHVYAYRRSKANPVEFMHRVLLSPADDIHVDHEDGDGLNNRRSNIRLATVSQNLANRRFGALRLGALRLGQLDEPGSEHEFLIEGFLSVAEFIEAARDSYSANKRDGTILDGLLTTAQPR